ncbi:hypothetical protein [Salinibacillus kushneri]|uniref:hypothetical protein n=1 Tax=Salinibacillus kushneri TaxID=237682 RepID=UPI001C658E83|nr:hypothetical protein [Salinibacillus kushneri]
MLLSLTLALVVATACGSNDENTSETSNASETNETSEDNSTEGESDDKAALLKNHVELANTLRSQYSAINDYIAALDEEDTDEETLETLKNDAITAAEEAINTLDSYELVQTDKLTDETASTFEEAIGDVKGAFEAYKSDLEADSNDFTAAEDKLSTYSEKVTPLFEDAGLSSTPDLASELQ